MENGSGTVNNSIVVEAANLYVFETNEIHYGMHGLLYPVYDA